MKELNRRHYGYNYSEIHTIAAIGDLPEPNVTGIVAHMNLTRGAVSKITKKLIEYEIIEAYQIEGNKQKIYFRLTEKGRFIYDEHEKRHHLWLERDDAFIKRFDQSTIEQVESFMRAFNEYLEEQIEELGGTSDEN